MLSRRRRGKKKPKEGTSESNSKSSNSSNSTKSKQKSSSSSSTTNTASASKNNKASTSSTSVADSNVSNPSSRPSSADSISSAASSVSGSVVSAPSKASASASSVTSNISTTNSIANINSSTSISKSSTPSNTITNNYTMNPTSNMMSNSNMNAINASAMKDLPALRDAQPAKREELFRQKLQLCSIIFSFDDPTVDKRGKDMKRQTLLELVDYVNTPAGQKIFTESVMADLMACVSANVCRALPPVTDDFDPEEDEPVLEPAWPHLQVAYEFFLRFIVSSEVNAKAAKKYVDQRFCLQLVELFDSEDPRERDYLKTILHRIYGKFMSHRSFIRRAISNVFYRFVYETERHNGIGELLEILGSIINGFAIPLKKEHLQFLVRALIPLHKPKCVGMYHQQLSYCIIQYVEKDADTAAPILNGFFKCWPWSCSGKQVLFLNELEEILELLGVEQLAKVSKTLFTNLARCLDSEHFQVVERALFLWNNEHLVNSGCLSRLNAHQVLPIIYGPLYKNSSGHWNATVEGLAQNVLKMYMEYDLDLYDKCTAAYFKQEEEAKTKQEAVAMRWAQIEEMAQENARERMMVMA
mmetsp:Transcript_11444/g.17372  ORF Transcript_11444/g.17372 Transcript_11444/m.17372 type:complete len:585 (-) Transcript_11444:221-1975(-)